MTKVKVANVRIMVYLLIMLVLLNSAIGVTQSIRGFISIPEYQIGCSGFEELVGRTFETYDCYFNYSRIARDDIQAGCFLLVEDISNGQVYLNKSFSEVFRKDNFPDSDFQGLYNYTTRTRIPLQFNTDGRHKLSFAFSNCEYEQQNGIIEQKEYDIVATGSYFIFENLKKELKESENRREQSDRWNSILAIVSIGLTFVAFIMAFILARKKQKAIVVDITESAADKIRKLLKTKKKKKI